MTNQIDARGPRFGAAITAILLAVVVVLGGSLAGLIVLAVVVASFAIGAAFGVGTTWQGYVYKKVVRPRLGAPKGLEDPAPPRFAQLVGLIVAGAGLLLGLIGFGWAIPLFAAIALVAAFLNAAFGFCLGCEMYLISKRIGARA